MAKLVKTALDAPLTLEDMQRMIGLCSMTLNKSVLL